MQNADKNCQERLWRNGIAPWNAVTEYCSLELLDAYRDACAVKSDDDRLSELILNWPNTRPGEPVPAYPGAYSHGRARRAKQRELLCQLEDELVEKFDVGELVPLGFVKPRNIDDAPVIIPLDMFDNRYGWSLGDQINGNGLEIEGVRIGKRHGPDAVTTIEPKIGRPSRCTEIHKAIQVLVDGDKNFLTGKRAPKLPLIRKMVYKLFPVLRGEDGLGDDVLDRELKRRIQAASVTTQESEKR